MHIRAIIAASSAVSTAIGAAAGYYYAKKRLTSYYEELSQKEIDQARAFYDVRDKKGDLSTPAKAVELLIGNESSDELHPETDELVSEAKEAMSLYQGTPVHVVTAERGLSIAPEKVVEAPEDGTLMTEEVQVTEKTSVFVDGEPLNREEFDLEEERNSRVNGVPYVISTEEHEKNEFNHDQVVLTWFVHDRVLLDENERQIDDVNDRVGNENLRKFGHGSGMTNIVFVRNEKLGVDYEILSTEKNYMETVLGLTSDNDDSMRHSSMPRRKTRRLSD